MSNIWIDDKKNWISVTGRKNLSISTWNERQKKKHNPDLLWHLSNREVEKKNLSRDSCKEDLLHRSNSHKFKSPRFKINFRTFDFIRLQDVKNRKRKKTNQKTNCTYLWTESLTTVIYDALIRFIASMTENVSLQPRSGARRFSKYLAASPQTNKRFTESLWIHMLCL